MIKPEYIAFLNASNQGQVVSTAAPLPVTSTSTPATVTDRSGSVTTGGTAQTLMAANTARNGFWIQNTSSADLWISDVGAAATASPSLKIVSGALYESPRAGVSTGLISIIGANAGQTFSAREW